MSTRAALLPTVAHALSASVYQRARSASLKTKLESVFGFQGSGMSTENGQTIVGAEEEPSTNDSTRFQSTSARMWEHLQGQIPKKHLIPRLTSLRAQDNTGIMNTTDEEEDLFASQAADTWHLNDDICPSQTMDEDLEEDVDIFADDSDEDEDLFASQDPDRALFDWKNDVGEQDEDLFEDLFTTGPISTPARQSEQLQSSVICPRRTNSIHIPQSFGQYIADADIPPGLDDGFDDDDLLLDLMLDEHMLDE